MLNLFACMLTNTLPRWTCPVCTWMANYSSNIVEEFKTMQIIQEENWKRTSVARISEAIRTGEGYVEGNLMDYVGCSLTMRNSYADGENYYQCWMFASRRTTLGLFIESSISSRLLF